MVSTYNNVKFDPEANALYIRLSKEKVVNTVPLGNRVYMDVDSENRPVGIEYLMVKTIQDSKILAILQNLVSN